MVVNYLSLKLKIKFDFGLQNSQNSQNIILIEIKWLNVFFFIGLNFNQTPGDGLTFHQT